MFTVNRYDIYGPIHKAIRAWSVDVLVRLGRTDWQDKEESAAILVALQELVVFHHSHLEHENEFAHPVLARLEPGSEAPAAAEHLRHQALLDDLSARVKALAAMADGQRETQGHQLYLAFAAFLAIDFEHMHDEETRHNAILWRHLSDAAIAAIEQALIATLPPEEMMQAMRWMLPNLTAAQRAEKFAGIRTAAPPPVVKAVTEILTATLTEVEMKRLWKRVAA